MDDILAKMRDLHRQAQVERSHYYTGSVLAEAIKEIERLRADPDVALAEALRELDEAASRVLRSLPAQTQAPLLEGALFIEARRKARAALAQRGLV